MVKKARFDVGNGLSLNKVDLEICVMLRLHPPGETTTQTHFWQCH